MSLELYQSHMKSLTLAVAVTALLLSVNASVFCTDESERSAEHLSCLLGERLCHLHDHVFISLFICNHVDAGDPLFSAQRKRNIVSSPFISASMLALAVTTHPSFRFEILDTL